MRYQSIKIDNFRCYKKKAELIFRNNKLFISMQKMVQERQAFFMLLGFACMVEQKNKEKINMYQ